MIRSTRRPFVTKASSPASSKSLKVRRICWWSSLSRTMASVDMVGLLGGGAGARARSSGAEVGGCAQPSYGRVLPQSRDLTIHGVERDVGVVAAGRRQEQHPEEVPLPR